MCIEDKKVFITTNPRFHEDYVNKFKPNSKMVLDEMLDARHTTSSTVSKYEVVVSDTPQFTIDDTQSNIIPVTTHSLCFCFCFFFF